MGNSRGLSNSAVEASDLFFNATAEAFGLNLIDKQTVKLRERALLA